MNADGEGDKSKVYDSFLTNFSEFQRLPVQLCLGEDITFETFVASQAKWHIGPATSNLMTTRCKELGKESMSKALLMKMLAEAISFTMSISGKQQLHFLCKE